jgi:hypothetical protein
VDILLTALTALLQLVMAGLGIYIALKPQPKERHLALIMGFVVLGLAGVGTSVWLQVRVQQSQKEQARLLESIKTTDQQILAFLPPGSTQETREIPAVTPHKEATSGQPLAAVPKAKPNTSPAGSDKEEPKILNDLKSLIAGQHWGLDAGHLALLSQRVAKYGSPRDRGDLITCILGDPDSTKFATNLVGAFRAAGWNLTGSGYSQAVFSGIVKGVVVKLHSKDSNPPGLNEFVATLRESGIEPTGEIDSNVPPDVFRIIIGMKPSA